MKSKTASFLPVVLFVCLCLSGCKDKDEAKNVLPQVCANFPDSVIFKFDKRVLWIQTRVDGISSELAKTMFEKGCEEAARSVGKIHINIDSELIFDQRKLLVLGFKQYVIVWIVGNGLDERGLPKNYELLTWQEAPAWFQQHLGYYPKPDQISVVTLEDTQNTPANQPMQLKTLAQLMEQKREQEELRKDELRKQEAAK